MIPILLMLLGVLLMPSAHGAIAGENLTYAVAYKGPDYSAVKTNIFSVDPQTAAKRLVFSDEKTSVVLRQKLYGFHFPVVGGRKLFGHATVRGKTAPFPGNGSLYELSTDNSNRFRRICPIKGTQSPGEIFVNAAETRIGYLNRMNTSVFIFVHDIATGTLLHQVDVSELFAGCYAASIGWLPHSEKLYFSLETGDDHLTSKSSHARVGTYVLDPSAGNLKKLPAVPAATGSLSPESARLLGVLPTGQYLFEIMRHAKGPLPHIALAKVKSDFSKTEDVSFSQASGLYSGIRVTYRLSPSGAYVSAARLPISASAVSADIWLKNLHTFKESSLLSFPTKGLQGPFLGLVGWLN